jgi:ribonucleoside-diphosphate reductase alpha chain
MLGQSGSDVQDGDSSALPAHRFMSKGLTRGAMVDRMVVHAGHGLAAAVADARHSAVASLQHDVRNAFTAPVGGLDGNLALDTAGMVRAVNSAVQVMKEVSSADRRTEARIKGYEGDSCGECGNFTLVRNGTCLKCDTCGGTSGCS